MCDIVAQFPQGQPAISHHLKVLRGAGLVTAERRGLWVYYRVSPSGLMEAWRAIGRLMP
ncbi:MAG: metalloregulator ArsR/SmtB family transcription factor [Bacillota bacterium]